MMDAGFKINHFDAPFLNPEMVDGDHGDVRRALPKASKYFSPPSTSSGARRRRHPRRLAVPTRSSSPTKSFGRLSRLRASRAHDGRREERGQRGARSSSGRQKKQAVLDPKRFAASPLLQRCRASGRPAASPRPRAPTCSRKRAASTSNEPGLTHDRWGWLCHHESTNTYSGGSIAPDERRTSGRARPILAAMGGVGSSGVSLHPSGLTVTADVRSLRSSSIGHGGLTG